MKLATFVLLCIGSAAAFSAPQKPAFVESAKKAVAAFAAASTILSNVAVVPAEAFSPDFDAGSSQVIAARSGGRAGGRSSRAPSRAAAPSRSTKGIERQTTIVQPPAYGGAAYMAPPPMYAPQPSGLGLAIGLNAVSGIAEGMREARQENEIRSTRDQLTEARIKEAEMEVGFRAGVLHNCRKISDRSGCSSDELVSKSRLTPLFFLCCSSHSRDKTGPTSSIGGRSLKGIV